MESSHGNSRVGVGIEHNEWFEHHAGRTCSSLRLGLLKMERGVYKRPTQSVVTTGMAKSELVIRSELAKSDLC